MANTPKPKPTHESWMGEGVSVTPGTKMYNDYKKSQMNLFKDMKKQNEAPAKAAAKRAAVQKKISQIPPAASH
jgi:hypothetical protein